MSHSSKFRIHPSIGIARVGNSPEFNLAPETLTGIVDAETGIIGGLPVKAGTEDEPIASSDLRDKRGALKRQAARFRIYHYPDGADTYPTGVGEEIRPGSKVDGKTVADIVWTVHLANKKAAGPVLENPNLRYAKGVDEKTFSDGQVAYIRGYEEGTNPYVEGEHNPFPPLRNTSFGGARRYRALVIDAGPRALSGCNAGPIEFDGESKPKYADPKGVIKSCDYPRSFPHDHFDKLYGPSGPISTLGTACTDAHGRLIVAGGYGRAVSWLPEGTALGSDTDNDGWFDDTSDGPVYATVVFDDGSTVEASNGWVVCTDPAYAPQVLNSVSLWDEFYDTFVRKLGLVPELYGKKFNAKYEVSFEQDVQPFLLSAALQQWTTNWPENATRRHDFIGKLETLKDFAFMDFIRRPDQTMSQSKMPLSLGDSGSAFLVPTETQDHLLRTAYRNGERGAPRPLGGGERLDRASLTNCLGGRFSPGIDMTFNVRQPDLYHQNWREVGPFRIRPRRIDYGSLPNEGPVLGQGYLPCQDNGSGVEPGDNCKFMALPWHTDYNSCAVHNPAVAPANPKVLYWSWPAQRPYAVRLADEVAVELTFTEDSLVALRDAAKSLPPKGIDGQVLEKMLDKNQAQLLAIGPCSEAQAREQVVAVVGDVSGAPLYVEFVMGFAHADIASEYRFSVRGRHATEAYDKQSGIYFDPIEMVKNWCNIGVSVQGRAIDTAAIGPYAQDFILETQSRLQAEGDLEVVEPWPDFPAIERELFYALQNVDDNPGILPKARMYAESALHGAWVYANGGRAEGYAGTIDPLGHFFEYSRDAFDQRLDEVYDALARQEQGYDPATDPLFRNRDAVVERIIQLAPFDLTDGAWLRNVNGQGPMDEVHTLISSIEQDERGNGVTSMNHCNIYRDLCHSAGFYPYPVDSRDFAMDPRFMDSAFSTSALELAISQFTETYYPELLGMTLQLEWSVLELKNTIKLLEYYGFDPHFYVMHVGIDNATNGHGERAKTAIELYLDQVRSASGESAMKEVWKRIWSGYVAFQYWGSGGADLFAKITQAADTKAALHERMVALVRQKAKYGRHNHDQHQIGQHKINDWFAYPEDFLKALQEAGYIIAGDAKNSRFFELLEFETGPMYRVFTPDEITLWKNWTNSLGRPEPEPAPVTTPEQDMVQLIETMKAMQAGNRDHQNISLQAPDGTERSIAAWFDQKPQAFMAALADERNGWVVRGHPDESLFINQLLAEARPMGKAIAGVVPNTGGKTGREVAVRWVESLGPAEQRRRWSGRVWLTSLHQLEPAERPLITGMGTVH